MMRIFTTIILVAFSFFSKAQTFTWTGYQHIANSSTISVPINVSGLPTSIDNNFGVAHICLNITHSYDSDLVVKLQSPAGTQVDLLNHIGGSGNNFTGTCLGMDGVSFTIAQPPYTGLFFPAGQPSDFNNGQNPNGTWTLTVTDVAAPDTGSIHTASIEFTNNPPSPNPGNGGPPFGSYECSSCVCPGGATSCDLLPDMTASANEILFNHQEEPGVLYISNATPNIGYGPLDIYGIDSCFCGGTHVPCTTVCPDGVQIQHVVKQRIYQKIPGVNTLGYRDRFAGKMTYHPQHGHIHVDNWANYTLRTPTSNPDATTWPIVARGTKQSFCLINLGSCASSPGECVDNDGNTVLTTPNNSLGFHTGCGLYQGIYPGSFDVYSINLNDPMPLVNVCNGDYYIVSITDPDNVFEESDENNNWVAVPITLTQQNVTPTITPNGSTIFCQGGSVTLTSNPAAGYLWSTGETTQSIVVTNAGTYTVSTTCGAATMVSAPVTTTILPANSTASVAISITTGSNPTCPGVYLVFTASAINGGNTPSYQWKVNGVNVGTNSPVYSTSTLTNGQVVSCVLTSTISCIANPIVSSNAITMNIAPAGDLGVNIIQPTGTNPACAGALITFKVPPPYGNNPYFQWKVNGINVGTNSDTYSSSNFTTGQTIRCEVTSNAVCPVEGPLGTATNINDFRSDIGACYPTYYGNGRQQYLITASELNGLGITAGRITSLAFQMAGGLGNPVVLHDYTIKFGQSPATATTGAFLTPAFTTVFGPVDYTPTLNSQNRHLFSAPFDWDGISSVIIDICYSSQVVGSAAYQNYQTPTSFNSTTYYEADGAGGAIACNAGGGGSGMVRPNMIFTVAEKNTAVSNTVTITVNPPVNVYTFTGSGNWNIASNWVNNTIPPAILNSCHEIIIDPPLGQGCVLNVAQTISSGAKITVRPNKKFRVIGSLTQLQ